MRATAVQQGAPANEARGEADQASKLEADLAKMWIGDRQQLDLSKP